MKSHLDSCSVRRVAYKLQGHADYGISHYVQPGLLSNSERARLDDMQLGPILAEVAATSTKHRDAAAKRAGGGYLGVSPVQRSGRTRWAIEFRRKGRVTAYKEYDSPEEAAMAYDALAWEHGGWYGAATRCVSMSSCGRSHGSLLSLH